MKEKTKNYIQILIKNGYTEVIPNMKWEKSGYDVTVERLESLNPDEFYERLNGVNRLIKSQRSKVIDFSIVMKDHAEWVKLFGERTPLSPLTHLREEIHEVIDNPKDIMEYADCATLLFDALRLAGFTLEDLEKAMSAKLQINKGREWIEVGEGDAKHWKHIQEVNNEQDQYNGNEPFKISETAKKIRELMPCGSPHSCDDCIHSFMATKQCTHLLKKEK